VSDTRAAERAGWVGWGIAVSIYLLAVLNRTTLGVAGLTAEKRFHITPAQLSVFVLLQIGVYAAMQVPAGVLVDRYGPRRMLFTAAVLMGCAQLAFAEVGSYPVALIARGFLGCGDAMTFVGVLRFIATHFSARRYPMLVALTAMSGQVGNLFATLPLTLLLRHAGWSPTFLVAGALTLGSGLAIRVFLSDSTVVPNRVRHLAQLRQGADKIRRQVAQAWAVPGTRLGFWVHYACMTPPVTLLVLWGQPYLVKGAGFSASGASAVLLTAVVVTSTTSFAIGSMMVRRPALRVPIALTQCVATMIGWTYVLAAFSSAPPHAVVVALFAVTALGAPTSMIGFALTRDYSPHTNLGTASGVVNSAGFTGVVIASLGIGWILDIVGSNTVGDYRVAMSVLIVLQAIGVVRLVVWRRRVRAGVLAATARGEQVPVPIPSYRRRHPAS